MTCCYTKAYVSTVVCSTELCTGATAHTHKDKDHRRGRCRPDTEQSQGLAQPGYLPGFSRAGRARDRARKRRDPASRLAGIPVRLTYPPRLSFVSHLPTTGSYLLRARGLQYVARVVCTPLAWPLER
jgi:hypothetical protein